VSDDGKFAVVVIALLGNPFSPAYARARKRGPANALQFCSMNVALYAKGASAWSLAECNITDSDRTASRLTIGKSSVSWVGDQLVVDIDERTTPLGRPVRGKIIVHPEAHTGLELSLDDQDQHRWWPIAPLARMEVDFSEPGARFSGHGYYDANAGDLPLESTFEHWSWSRARLDDGALLTYDVTPSQGSKSSLAFKISARGEIEKLDHLVQVPLPRTRWGLDREARIEQTENASPVRVLRSLEDGPFYSRALVETHVDGERVVAMHETLAAHRLRRGIVRILTEFRMRRIF
jgi:carotenoid 1,2-hydratase